MSLFEHIKKNEIPLLLEAVKEEDFVSFVLPLVKQVDLRSREDLVILIDTVVPERFAKKIDTEVLWQFLRKYL